jgi:hypothetical protein
MGAIVFRHHIFHGPDRGCEADPHGLAVFTGHSLESGDNPYETPGTPHIHLHPDVESPEESCDKIYADPG